LARQRHRVASHLALAPPVAAARDSAAGAHRPVLARQVAQLARHPDDQRPFRGGAALRRAGILRPTAPPCCASWNRVDHDRRGHRFVRRTRVRTASAVKSLSDPRSSNVPLRMSLSVRYATAMTTPIAPEMRQLHFANKATPANSAKAIK